MMTMKLKSSIFQNPMNINLLPAMFAIPTMSGARHVVESRDTSPRRPATEAAAAVQAYLNDSPSLTGNHIRCEADDNCIVLGGYVSTYSMKHTARVLAESVSGEWRIEDRLDVIPIPPKWDQNVNCSQP